MSNSAMACAAQGNVTRQVAVALEKDGFAGSVVVAALSYLFNERSEDVAAALESLGKAAAAEGLSTVLREKTLQHLCLMLPDSAIPSEFHASRAIAATSIALGGLPKPPPNSSKTPVPAPSPPRLSWAPDVQAWYDNITTTAVDVAVGSCAGYGWTSEQLLCVAACINASSSSSSYTSQPHLLQRHAVLSCALLASNAQAGATYESATATAVAAQELVGVEPVSALDVAGEVEILESIFPGAISVDNGGVRLAAQGDGAPCLESKARDECLRLRIALDTSRLDWPATWKKHAARDAFALDVFYTFNAASHPLGPPRLAFLKAPHSMIEGVDADVSALRAVQVALQEQVAATGDAFSLLAALEDGSVHVKAATGAYNGANPNLNANPNPNPNLSYSFSAQMLIAWCPYYIVGLTEKGQILHQETNRKVLYTLKEGKSRRRRRIRRIRKRKLPTVKAPIPVPGPRLYPRI